MTKLGSTCIFLRLPKIHCASKEGNIGVEKREEGEEGKGREGWKEGEGSGGRG